MSFEKYNNPGWQGREDYIKLNTKAIYIPQYTMNKLVRNIKKVSIYYDKEAKAIKLVADQQGLNLTFRKSGEGYIGTSLSRVMDIGWYVWKEGLVFVFDKPYEPRIRTAKPFKGGGDKVKKV